MTDYYISKTNGNDADDGESPGGAWETVDKVNQTAFDHSDRVHFLRGDEWAEALVVPSPGVLYGAYGYGARPALNRVEMQSKPGVVLESLRFVENETTWKGYIHVSDSPFVALRDCVVIGEVNNGIYGLEGSTNLTIDGCRIMMGYDDCRPGQGCCVKLYDGCHDTVLRNSEMQGNQFGMRWVGSGTPSNDRVKVIGNIFRSNGRAGGEYIDEGAVYPQHQSGFEIAYNTIIDSHAYGIGLESCSDVDIHNNVIDGAESDGLDAWQLTGDSRIYRNRFFNVGKLGVDIQGTRGIAVEGVSKNVRVEHNTVYNATGWGIIDMGWSQTEEDDEDNTFIGNVVIGGCEYAGLFVKQASGSKWEHNIVVDVAGRLFRVDESGQVNFQNDRNLFWTINPTWQWDTQVKESLADWQISTGSGAKSAFGDWSLRAEILAQLQSGDAARAYLAANRDEWELSEI